MVFDSNLPRPLTIAFFFDHMGLYQDRIWAGIAAVVREQNANLLTFSGEDLGTRITPHRQGSFIYNLMLPEAIDGLIILSHAFYNTVGMEQIQKFCERYASCPIVSIGQIFDGIPSILIDNKTDLNNILVHLIEFHGYRRIAFICGPEGHYEAAERFQAYLDTLDRYNIPLDLDLVVPGDFHHEAGIKAVQLLLDKRQTKFEAIVAANDNMAIGACRELAARGILVPSEVAVTGFDDVTEAKVAASPLTTVHQSLYRQGREAASMIFARIRGESLPDKVVLPTKLVIRESCGCLSSATHQAAIHAVSLSSGVERSHLLSRIEQTITQQFPGLERELLAQLLVIFFDEVNGKVTNKFLPAFSKVLGRTASEHLALENSTFMVWHDILSTLRREAFPYLDQGHQLNHADNLIHQGRVMIGESAGNAQTYLRIRADELIATHNAIMRRLMATHQISEIADVLAENLPLINIKHCYLALFDGDTTWSRLILAYDDQGRIELGPEGLRFPSEQLIPRSILRSSHLPFLMVQALHSKGKLLGFILIEMVVSAASMYSVYEDISEQISSALNSALLAQQLAQRAEELAQQAKELVRSNAELEQFAYVASHDLQEPLRMVTSYLQLLERRYKGQLDTDADEFIMYAVDGARRMKTLINDLLTYSRVGTRGKTFAPTSCDKVLDEVLNNLQIAIEESNAVITHDALPNVMSDESQMIQLFQNLIANAIKFRSEKKPEIKIGVVSEETQWVFRVQDNGIGINPEYFDRLFILFQRLHTREKYPGTGIGLAVCKKIVERHGGRIWVESQPDAGTVFYFTIPK